MTPRLSAKKISVKVQGRLDPILSDINFDIFDKEFVVVLGHNGSGKSSLIKILSGEMNPTSGKVYVDDIAVKNFNSSLKSTELVTLTQRSEDRLFFDMTLMENIMLWESRFQFSDRVHFNDILNLTNEPKKFLSKLDQPVRTLSGGEKQSFLLALALAHPPKILFLDEHTSSLDPKASINVMDRTAEAIKNHKITALMVTHNLEDAVKYGSRIIILHEGHIVIDMKKDDSFSMRELKKIMAGV